MRLHQIGCMIAIAMGGQPPNIPKAGRPMVIYRISKGRKLYLRRLVAQLPLWHPDPAVALQLDADRAQHVVDKLRQSLALSGGSEIGVE